MAATFPKPAARTQPAPAASTEPTSPTPTAETGPLTPAPADKPAEPQPWGKEFDSTWNLLGHALRFHFGITWNRLTSEQPKQDWWVIGGDVARIALAVYRKDSPAVALGVEQLLRDLGVAATAEQMRAIGRALIVSAETLPLVSGTPESPSPALPKQPEKE